MTVDESVPSELGLQAERAVRAEAEQAEQTAEVSVHEDRTRELRTPGFSRMRTEWHGHDAAQISSLKHIVDGTILRLFADAEVGLQEVAG